MVESQEEEFLRAAAFGSNGSSKLKRFLENGVDVNCRVLKAFTNKDMSEGMSGLSLAINNCQLNVAEFLLDNGADTESADLFGCTAMHYAAVLGDIEAITLLIKYGAKVDSCDINENTPLINAMWRMGVEFPVVKALIENGADIFAKNDRGQSPYDLITLNKNAMDQQTIDFVQGRYEEIALSKSIKSNDEQMDMKF